MNIEEELKYFTDIVGLGNEEVFVIGPKSELDMLREPLKSINTKFFETFIGAVKTFNWKVITVFIYLLSIH